ncbi:MAG: NAD-dependent epimerase/dehydratase family protein [Solirubrobacteraceae bacterium]
MQVTATTSSRSRALVTGAGGFMGRHLVASLQSRGYEVFGSGRGPQPAELVLHGWMHGDLRDDGFAADLVRATRPTHVFHLAGVFGRTAADRRVLFDTHVLGTADLLDAVVAESLTTWVCVSSSSAVYGPRETQPIPETGAVRPLNDYGVSKAAEELVAARFRLSEGLTCCALRLFNLVGPGLSDALVISALARQVATQELGGHGVVYVGNLEPRRDFLDVRDAVRAIVDLADLRCGEPLVNIGSGRSRSVRHCLDLLLAGARRTLSYEIDPGRVRRHEIPDQRADVSLLTRLTRWSPTIELSASLGDLLAHWRDRVSREVGR